MAKTQTLTLTLTMNSNLTRMVYVGPLAMAAPRYTLARSYGGP